MGHVYSETQTDSSEDAARSTVAAPKAQRAAKPHPSTSVFRHGPSAAAWRRAHEKMKADDALWTPLSFDGIQHDGGGGLLEHRRCPCCGSTLSRRTTALHAVVIVANLSQINSRSLDAIVHAGEAAQRIEPSDECLRRRTQSA